MTVTVVNRRCSHCLTLLSWILPTVGGSNAWPDPAPKKVSGSGPRKTYRIYAPAARPILLHLHFVNTHLHLIFIYALFIFFFWNQLSLARSTSKSAPFPTIFHSCHGTISLIQFIHLIYISPGGNNLKCYMILAFGHTRI